ncbi:MAG: serine/threonine-protein kinase [Planctomycetota bacterium]
MQQPRGRIGPYLLFDELGRGGMGAVYRARHAELGREVALKVQHEELGNEVDRERFLREGQALARLAHPAIVRVYERGQQGDKAYLAMELVDGEGLDQRLKREGPLEPRVAAQLALSLAEGLAHAHEHGVLHRDLKPSNVLVDREGRARLTDFGLAKALDARSLTRTGQVLGTPAYMAPEQADGQRHAMGPATDVYGLGATLYALLSGRAPFEASTVLGVLELVLNRPPHALREVRPEVDPALAAICERCLQKDPAARFQTMSELAAALRAWGAGEARAPRGGRARAAVAALVVLAGLGAGGLALWRARSGAPKTGSSEAPETPASAAQRDLDAAQALQDPGARWRALEAWRRARGPSATSELLARADELERALEGEARRALAQAKGNSLALADWLDRFGAAPEELRQAAARDRAVSWLTRAEQIPGEGGPGIAIFLDDRTVLRFEREAREDRGCRVDLWRRGEGPLAGGARVGKRISGGCVRGAALLLCVDGQLWRWARPGEGQPERWLAPPGHYVFAAASARGGARWAYSGTTQSERGAPPPPRFDPVVRDEGVRDEGTGEAGGQATERIMRRPDEQRAQLYTLAFSPDGSLLAGGGGAPDQGMREDQQGEIPELWVWKVETGQPLELPFVPGPPQALGWSSDGSLLAVATHHKVVLFRREGSRFGAAGELLLLDERLAQEVGGTQVSTGRGLRLDAQGLLWCAFDYAGAGGARRGRLSVWDLAELAPTRSPAPLRSLDFEPGLAWLDTSPDGRLVVAASFRGEAYLVDGRTPPIAALRKAR